MCIWREKKSKIERSAVRISAEAKYGSEIRRQKKDEKYNTRHYWKRFRNEEEAANPDMSSCLTCNGMLRIPFATFEGA